jgi:GcrA cell cycle regulator
VVLELLLLKKILSLKNPTSLENLNEKTCRWPIGHPDEANFYFCGRNPMEERVYCKLHVLHAYQPKGWKNDEEEDKNAKEQKNFQSFLKRKLNLLNLSI